MIQTGKNPNTFYRVSAKDIVDVQWLPDDVLEELYRCNWLKARYM